MLMLPVDKDCSHRGRDQRKDTWGMLHPTINCSWGITSLHCGCTMTCKQVGARWLKLSQDKHLKAAPHPQPFLPPSSPPPLCRWPKDSPKSVKLRVVLQLRLRLPVCLLHTAFYSLHVFRAETVPVGHYKCFAASEKMLSVLAWEKIHGRMI